MIDVKIDRSGNRDSSVVMHGKVSEILTDIGTMINGMYMTIKRDDPNTAESFRKILTDMVTAQGSPVWKPMFDITVLDFSHMARQQEDAHGTKPDQPV